ncbi:MAG: glycosyltransferase family 4 protein [Nitrospinota bacterium]|jgi:UDP-glucose:(heptosyl)LPS alpha-1,3-glucosyltransferase|nr:glycosyltransferase family 4 protein [Nitrospinota bacterium]HJM43904.1 glycosyltransferase family 4 protein [Nitrospinota bacterium]
MNDDRPLRIALVRIAAHRRGGVERYVWGFARDLAARGHEVHLFARHWEALPGSIIRRPVGRLGGLSVLKAWSFARGVVHALRGGRYDTVYNFDRTPVRGIYRAGEGCHREWLRVAAAHLPPASRMARRLDPLHAFHLSTERRIFSKQASTGVVAISRKVREDILRHYGAPEGDALAEKDVTVIYNGVDLEEFSPAEDPGRKDEIRKALGIDPGDFVVLFVGSGFFRKGLVHLLRAAAKLRNGTRRIRVLIIAPPGRRPAAARMARRLGVGKIVGFPGEETQTADAYRASDVFVLPSLYEPFGFAALEALASGIPCILSQPCGASEIMTEGETGLILEDPTDADGLAARLERLFDEDLRRTMGRSARRLAERFPISRNTDRMLAVHREIQTRAGST